MYVFSRGYAQRN